jgi:transcription antitermination factor NusG
VTERSRAQTKMNTLVTEPTAARLETPVIADDLERGTCLQPQWYAAYTCANHERRVADQLASRGVEYFLPHYESVRRWKDRKVRLRMPLFPGYILVQVALRDRLRVLEVPSVVRLVGFNGRPAPLPEADVTRIREFLERGFRAEPHPYLTVGKRVRVKNGPLAGMEGILSRRKGKLRVVISIELVQRAVAVDVGEADVESWSTKELIYL